MADSPSCCSLPSPAKYPLIFQYAISCDSGHQQFWKSISKQHQEGHQAHSLWQTMTRLLETVPPHPGDNVHGVLLLVEVAAEVILNEDSS